MCVGGQLGVHNTTLQEVMVLFYALTFSFLSFLLLLISFASHHRARAFLVQVQVPLIISHVAVGFLCLSIFLTCKLGMIKSLEFMRIGNRVC